LRQRCSSASQRGDPRVDIRHWLWRWRQRLAQDASAITNGTGSGGETDGGRGDSAAAMDGSKSSKAAISAARIISQPIRGLHPTK
jgi:hypothetical protein